MADAQEPKPRYRPWPKKHDGLRRVIDRDKLRDQYLSQGKYSWPDFCKDFNYNPDPRHKTRMPVKAWQQEWIAVQVNTTEDSMMDEAMKTKIFIAKARLAFPQEWNKTAEALKSLGDYILQAELDNAAWDQQHAADIEADPKKRRCKLTPSNLLFLATAQKKVMELHRESLLFVSGDSYKAVIPIRDSDPELVHAESEGERLRAIETRRMNGDGLDAKKMTHIISQWIDQQAEPLEVPNGEEAKDPLDTPLDELVDP